MRVMRFLSMFALGGILLFAVWPQAHAVFCAAEWYQGERYEAD